MLKTARFALVAVAVLSAVLFSTPASAGMVATPAAPASESTEREMALQTLKARLAESGVDAARYEAKLDRMPTQDLVQLSQDVEAARHAGSTAVAIAVAVAVVGALVLVIMETYHPN